MRANPGAAPPRPAAASRAKGIPADAGFRLDADDGRPVCDSSFDLGRGGRYLNIERFDVLDADCVDVRTERLDGSEQTGQTGTRAKTGGG